MSHLLQIHEPGETPAPHAGEHGVAIGIDLGTTHSVVAVATDEGVEVLRDAHGHALVPSVVYYGGDVPMVGHMAREKWMAGDAKALASIKRRMHDAAQRVAAGEKQVTPVEVSAEILRHVKAVAEHALEREVTQAVITVPAYFDDTARSATKDAARLAGLEVLRLVNEPTAAAFAYGLDSGAEGVYAIYDLGGGTFDISLLKLEQGVFQVLATGGDTQLGGDDFDAALAGHLTACHPGAGRDPRGFLVAAKFIKEKLSESESVSVQDADKDPGLRRVDIKVTRAELDALLFPFIERTINVCKQVLQDAQVTASDIQGVVLVGGSTRIPLVRTEVENFFGRAPYTGVNPDEVVAAGAALQARNLTHGADSLLLDVIPLSLGLETMGGLTEKLIHRNTPIPVSVSQEFTTYQDNQTGMQIHVLQGEREMVHQNRSLARFELTGIPALPAGIARIEVTFTVDADGLLTVSAREQMTGKVQHVEIRPSYGLPPEEIERMLVESMEHARADITERLLAEARVEAERAVIELESAMKTSPELLNDAEKRIITNQLKYVREAIAGDDRERIDVEMQQLSHAAHAFAERRMNAAVGQVLTGKKVGDTV